MLTVIIGMDCNNHISHITSCACHVCSYIFGTSSPKFYHYISSTHS